MTKRWLILLLVWQITGATVYGQDVVKLHQPKIRGQVMKALKNRTSIKGFKQKELPDKVLSDVLWAAFGVTDPKTGRRTAPSAFNAREIDIYVLKADGAYLYDAPEHGLRRVNAKDIRSIVARQNYAKTAPVHLVYVADYEKADAVYPASFGNDKDKWSMMHTGFISQNVILYCSIKGMSTVVRSFGNRASLRKGLRLRNSQEIIITQAIGYSPK